MRRATFAGLAGVIVFAFAIEATAQQPPKPAAEGRIFIFTSVKILDSDGALPKLLKQRFNAAGEELEARSELYSGGRVELDAVLASIERFTKYGLELAESPALQVEHLDRALLAAKKVEAIVREKYDHGNEPVQAMKHANVVRYDLEIQRYRAQELVKAKASR